MSQPNELRLIGGQGDVLVVLSELERVQGIAVAVGGRLETLFDLGSWLGNPVQTLILRTLLDEIFRDLGRVILACEQAKAEYLSTEAAILAVIDEISTPVVAGFLLAQANRLGIFEEHPVASSPIGSGIATAPRSLAEIARRLEEASRSSQIVIESHALVGEFSHGAKRHLIYLSGTQEWNLQSGENPFDLTSNLHAMAEPAAAASERAALQLLEQQELDPRDEVVLIGHSQGGMIAASLASSLALRQRKVTLLTFGAPLAQRKLAPGVLTLALEHNSDTVPNLALRANPPAPNHVTVSRDLPVSQRTPVASHSLANYQETAALVDSKRDPRIARLTSRIFGELAPTGIGQRFAVKRLVPEM